MTRFLLALALTPVLAFQSVAQTPGQAVRATMGTEILLTPVTLAFPNTGLSILDSDSSHKLTLSTGSNLTAARTLTINPGDAARTLTLSGNATLNQDVSTTGSPSFNAVSATSFSGDGSQLTDLTIGELSGLNANVATFMVTPSSANLALAVTGETGSGALVFGTQPTITFANTGLTVLDTNATHTLSIVPGSNISANRTLTLTTGDASRIVTITGDATLDQDVAVASSPTFNDLNIDGTISGDGSGLTNLNAGNVSSGTLAVARGGTGVTTSTGTGSTVLSANPTFTGTLTCARIDALSLTSAGHHFTVSNAAACDGTIYLQNLNASRHSAVCFLRDTDTGVGTAAISVGNAGASTEYANRYFISSNPPGGVGSPLDITICQEENISSAGYLAHRKLFFDATARSVTCYGITNGAVVGPVGWNVASDGRMGVGTSTLFTAAQLSVGGHLALNGATRNTISFGTTGFDAPSATNGAKIQLYAASLTPSVSDFTIGVESGAVWYNVDSGAAHRFYFGGVLGLEITAGGNLKPQKTITAAGTTGAQTINKPSGSVNFAAAAQTLVVTNSLVTASSVVIATVATDDTTASAVKAIPASGSFTLKLNAAATAETRVNFLVTN